MNGRLPQGRPKAGCAPSGGRPMISSDEGST